MQTDKEAFREFARGFAFCLSIMVVALVLVIGIFSIWGEKPQDKFKVVDQYGSCEVVRYTDDTNRWHYFLDCK